ncbi:penicillin-binding protein 2 [Acetobacteraceae bacterium H6797]|nr:penicillin-binding protein 2 [Acetobacteraceae bacterium H6797]
MNDLGTPPPDQQGPPGAPSPDALPAGRPLGFAPRQPSRALQRVAQPDHARRALMERTRTRLVIAAAGFTLLFGAVGLKLADATIVSPREPRRLAHIEPPSAIIPEPMAQRAPITDRNGEILAVSLPVSGLYANPRQIPNPVEVADKLRSVLPQLDRDRVIARLSSDKGFVYLTRYLTPRQMQAVNDLGIPGLYFEETERRFYPQGRAAVHVVGGVDVDGNGTSGVERYFDERLRERRADALKLAIDVRVQLAARDALAEAISDYSGIGGAAIVMDINTAEVLAMVSLPDYDANNPLSASHCAPELNTVTNVCERFNRAISGVFEPGSTFKLLTSAAAIDYGTANPYVNSFDASKPMRFGRFSITDYKGKNRWLSFPEVLIYSSNLGAAHIAETFGEVRQRQFLERMGMLRPAPIELPEVAPTMTPSARNWHQINMVTISYGHGIAVTPLHVVRAVSAIANGGILRAPTILAQPPGEEREGVRVLQPRTSELMRRLMRIVVTDGSGKSANVPGYFVGGKTGTAQKTGPHGGYLMNKRIAAFVGAFPMQAPRYAVYVMVDEPNPNARSYGYATAGWVAAPAAGAVIKRIAPILGLVPDDPNNPAIIAATSIPAQPRPPGPANAARPAPPESNAIAPAAATGPDGAPIAAAAPAAGRRPGQSGAQPTGAQSAGTPAATAAARPAAAPAARPAATANAQPASRPNAESVAEGAQGADRPTRVSAPPRATQPTRIPPATPAPSPAAPPSVLQTPPGTLPPPVPMRLTSFLPIGQAEAAEARRSGERLMQREPGTPPAPNANR